MHVVGRTYKVSTCVVFVTAGAGVTRGRTVQAEIQLNRRRRRFHARIVSRAGLQPCCNPLRSLGRRDHRNDVELDEVAPLLQPPVEEISVHARHDLIAAREVICDPAAHVRQTIRDGTAFLLEASVNGAGISVSKSFDNHELHGTERLVPWGERIVRWARA